MSVCVSNIRYLIGIAVILNVAAASPAFVIIEVHVGKRDGGEVLIVGTEPATTWGVRSLSTAGAAHMVDDSIDVDVDL